MITINVDVSGVQAMINEIIKNSSTGRKDLLTEVSNLLVSRAKGNAHVITGNMKSNISVTSIQDKSATVTAAANYSVYENRRPGSKGALGTHDFMDKAVNSVKKDLPSILQRHQSKWSGGK